MATLQEPYESTIRRYQKELSSSPTAYTPNTKPSFSDLQNETNLRSAEQAQETAKGKSLRELYYGSDPNEQAVAEEGRVSKALGVLGTPLYAGVGAVEAVLGKGTKKGIENIKANVKERGTYGDLLRSYNISNLVSAPLGFALDVAMDPVNWATAGTAAFVPKVGKGLIKGGVKGAALGAKSGALNMAQGAMSMIPGLEKNAFSIVKDSEGVLAPAATGKLATFFRKTANAAEDASMQFEEQIGSSMQKALKTEDWRTSAIGLGSKRLEEALGKDKYSSLKNMFHYDSNAWVAQARKDARDKVSTFGRKELETDELLKAASGKQTKAKAPTTVEESINEGLEIADNPEAFKAATRAQVDSNLAGEFELKEMEKQTIFEQFEKMKTLLKNEPEYLRKLEEYAQLPEGEAREKALQKLSNLYTSLETGYNKADKLWSKAILHSPKSQKTLETYLKYIGLFKWAKTAANPATWTSSVMGNIFMTAQAGLNISRAQMYESMLKAIKITSGKHPDVITEMISNPKIADLLMHEPELFKATMGVTPEYLLNPLDYINNKMNEAVEMSKGDKSRTIGAVKDKFQDYINLFQRSAPGATVKPKPGQIDFFKSYKKASAGKYGKEAASPVEIALTPGAQSTFFAQETLIGVMGQFVKDMEKWGNDGSLFYKTLHKIITGSTDIYSKSDQTFKLGLLLHMSNNGITEKELRLMIPRFGIKESNVERLPGRNLWQVNPDKAIEIVNEIYMNYAAMPSFVRVMRTLPIVGSPFMSFAYGALSQTGKSAVYNPAFFNNVNNFLHEMSGRKSPLEKEALSGPYYDWLNQPSMAKIPFFEKNPLYLNMGGMLNYYQLSLLTPPTRSYGKGVGGAITRLIDSSPFFKSPEGQTLLDYAIIPHLIGEAQGSFGQPLYKPGTGVIGQTGHAIKDLAGAVIPNSVGVVGAVPNTVPESFIPYLPSYTWRATQYATKGQNAYGIPTKEDPVAKTVKRLSALLGLPVYSIDLDTVKPNKK